MPTYLTLAVYVDEVARRPQSIGEIGMSVAESVDDLLARSGDFVALGVDARQGMARDMVRIATALLTASEPDDDREDEPPQPLALAVDFPAFVANLISGSSARSSTRRSSRWTPAPPCSPALQRRLTRPVTSASRRARRASFSCERRFSASPLARPCDVGVAPSFARNPTVSVCRHRRFEEGEFGALWVRVGLLAGWW